VYIRDYGNRDDASMTINTYQQQKWRDGGKILTILNISIHRAGEAKNKA